uniref:DUF8207 domain-containing protein n=1 Tax=Trichogramma kaykai TaxID=54128 RepID=A0ABD2WH01_9HYME
MNSLQNEQNILKQLINSREAVRKKYKLIKSGAQEIEQILTKTFQPITKPLHKLVDLTADDDDGRHLSVIKKRKSILSELKKEEEKGLKEDEEEEEEIDQNLQDFHSPLEEINNPNDAVASTSSEEHYDRHRGFLNTYLTYITTRNPNKIIDEIGGVRLGRGNNTYQLRLGNSDISFRDKFIVLDEQHQIIITPGLVELIFKNIPDVRLYNEMDLAEYRKILTITNAHKIQYNPKGEIRGWNRHKYTQIINPLFEKKPIGSGVLPHRLKSDYKIAYLKPKKFYRYWDDPNEFCERLKLLIAEKNAGNGAHSNEIHSIIEELREAGYIS